MSKSVFIKGGILTLADVDFKCPNCQHEYGEDFYYKQLYNSAKGLIYKVCKGCKKKMGITSDMKGDVVVWLKENEERKTW